jgi:hypothetical protein
VGKDFFKKKKKVQLTNLIFFGIMFLLYNFFKKNPSPKSSYFFYQNLKVDMQKLIQKYFFTLKQENKH